MARRQIEPIDWGRFLGMVLPLAMIVGILCMVAGTAEIKPQATIIELMK